MIRLRISAQCPISWATWLRDFSDNDAFWWNAYEHGDKVVLTICVVPMQYNPDTKEVTMYNHLEFDVDYTSPSQVARIDSVTVNNNQVISVGKASVPVELALSSQKGLVRGYSDNTFRPNNNATRAETCAMIKRLLDLGNQNALE